MCVKNKLAFLCVILALTSLVLASCSGAARDAGTTGNGSVMYDKVVMETTAAAMSESYDYYDMDAPMRESAPEIGYASGTAGNITTYSTKAQSAASNQQSAVTDTRKIIRTVNLSLETKTFDKAVSDITAEVAAIGGYIESSHVSGRGIDAVDSARYASFTVRVPATALDSYVEYIEGSYHVTSHNTNASDITDSYYDTESRLKSLLTQEERLLEMLEGAKDLEYMLKIEDKLANIRYQIESYHSTLSRYDKQVAMSTVHISLNEVMEYKPVVELPKTFGQRMSQAIRNSWKDFVRGWENFAIDFVYALPGLIMFALFVLIVVLIIRLTIKRIRKKNRARREAEAAAIADNNEQLEAIRRQEQQNK